MCVGIQYSFHAFDEEHWPKQWHHCLFELHLAHLSTLCLISLSPKPRHGGGLLSRGQIFLVRE